MDKFNIITEKSNGFEVNNIAKSVINFFLIPILNNLPPKSVELIKKSNKGAKEVVENATTHTALELLYNKGFMPEKQSLLTKFFLKIWFNINNAKAVRNRLKIVRREFKKILLEKSKIGDYIHILSIASGSARAILEVLSDKDIVEEIDLDLISVTFIDKNPKAIEYSKELSKKVSNYNFNWINDSVGNYFRTYEFKEGFDIVEMVGLLDYFDNEQSIKIFNQISKKIKDGGVLITANINNNPERKFLTRTIGWNMRYRSAEELLLLLTKSGFDSKLIKAYYEPLKIHSIVVAIKK
ncbi:MAG: class I SAM-dependent methyltransferase [Patescibacteria group bacterium]